MTEPSPDTVLAFLQPGAEGEAVIDALEAEGLHVEVRRPGKGEELWKGARSASALLLDEGVAPQALQRARDLGWVGVATPVFALGPRPPSRGRYMAWLKAGAWSFVRVPLESAALALQLKNILSGQPSRQGQPHRRYALRTLEQVAAETLSLARRYERPLHCVAMRHDREGEEADEAADAARLAEEAEMLIRTSDLVGIADRTTVLVLLPDTDAAGTARFLDRLTEVLEARLEDGPASTTVATASIEEVESGRELLDLARQRLEAIRP